MEETIEERYKRYDILFANQIKNGLHIDLNIDDICKELAMYFKNPGRLNAQPNKNKIIYYFQQDNFYREEKKIFSTNPDLRHKLIDNRVKYLSEISPGHLRPAESLTDAELLRGFKISKIHQSYSHFSPYWTKYFVEKNNLKCVADPFGGWGHHMIGILAAGAKCIYNDLSHHTVMDVIRMNDFIHSLYPNTESVITEGDAKDFSIPDECDGVFMCPPYFNIEIYECGKFNSREDFDNVIKSVLENWFHSKARTLGIIIREDYEYLFANEQRDENCVCDFMPKWSSKEPVNTRLDHLSKAGKIYEYLYTFNK